MPIHAELHAHPYGWLLCAGALCAFANTSCAPSGGDFMQAVAYDTGGKPSEIFGVLPMPDNPSEH